MAADPSILAGLPLPPVTPLGMGEGALPCALTLEVNSWDDGAFSREEAPSPCTDGRLELKCMVGEGLLSLFLLREDWIGRWLDLSSGREEDLKGSRWELASAAGE